MLKDENVVVLRTKFGNIQIWRNNKRFCRFGVWDEYSSLVFCIWKFDSYEKDTLIPIDNLLSLDNLIEFLENHISFYEDFSKFCLLSHQKKESSYLDMNNRLNNIQI